jgi:hypothetical protein
MFIPGGHVTIELPNISRVFVLIGVLDDILTLFVTVLIRQSATLMSYDHHNMSWRDV